MAREEGSQRISLCTPLVSSWYHEKARKVPSMLSGLKRVTRTRAAQGREMRDELPSALLEETSGNEITDPKDGFMLQGLQSAFLTTLKASRWLLSCHQWHIKILEDRADTAGLGKKEEEREYVRRPVSLTVLHWKILKAGLVSHLAKETVPSRLGSIRFAVFPFLTGLLNYWIRVYLHFSKAFNTVSPTTLVKMMERWGVDRNRVWTAGNSSLSASRDLCLAWAVSHIWIKTCLSKLQMTQS